MHLQAVQAGCISPPLPITYITQLLVPVGGLKATQVHSWETQHGYLFAICLARASRSSYPPDTRPILPCPRTHLQDFPIQAPSSSDYSNLMQRTQLCSSRNVDFNPSIISFNMHVSFPSGPATDCATADETSLRRRTLHYRSHIAHVPCPRIWRLIGTSSAHSACEIPEVVTHVQCCLHRHRHTQAVEKPGCPGGTKSQSTVTWVWLRRGRQLEGRRRRPVSRTNCSLSKMDPGLRAGARIASALSSLNVLWTASGSSTATAFGSLGFGRAFDQIGHVRTETAKRPLTLATVEVEACRREARIQREGWWLR